MDQENKSLSPGHIKDARQRKGYTQQELADLTGISIRSVQRIENGEVTPRGYTLRVLAEQLDLKHMLNTDAMPGLDTRSSLNPREDAGEPAPGPVAPQPDAHRLDPPGKIVLTAGIGIFLVLGGLAFISQSARFPETDFEGFCFWAVVAVLYTLILLRIWK